MKILSISLSRRICPCPECGQEAAKTGVRAVRLKECGMSGPVMLELTLSDHVCPKCGTVFSPPMELLADPDSGYTLRARNAALGLYRESLDAAKASAAMREKCHVDVSPETIAAWAGVEAPAALASV